MLNTKEHKDLYTLYMSGRRHRVLVVTDIHLREIEFSMTKNYVVAQESVILRLIEGAERGLYDTIILLGDLFDCPYKNLSKAFYHVALIERLYRAVEGRLFKVISNHPINNKRNYMVTFFLTGMMKSVRCSHYNMTIERTLGGFNNNYGISEPYLIVPDRLFINGNLFNFFHFNKEDKKYYDPLAGVEYKKHIGLYHDNILTDEANIYVSELATGGRFKLPHINIGKDEAMLSNVDYAVFGDVHTKIGEFVVENTITGQSTLADVPGTCGRTANHSAQLHNEVLLPIFDVSEDGTIKKEHLKFPLVDYRTIFKMEEQSVAKEDKNRMETFKKSITEIANYVSFEDYLENDDSSPETKQLIKKILNEKHSNPSYLEDEYYVEKIRAISSRFN